MRLLLPTSVSLLMLLSWQTGRAQTADDFFNSGAQFYISNNIPSALEKTENGLKLYPDDVKLQKLEKLLKQQQQSQQNQQQQNQQKQSQSQKSQGQQQKNQQQQQNSQKQEQQKQQEQKKASAEKQNEEKKEKAEEQQSKPGQMTPEEAKRLLDSQKGDEQVLQLKPQGSPQNSSRPFKDW
jgi:Ca-activated chloride channel family protein